MVTAPHGRGKMVEEEALERLRWCRRETYKEVVEVK